MSTHFAPVQRCSKEWRLLPTLKSQQTSSSLGCPYTYATGFSRDSCKRHGYPHGGRGDPCMRPETDLRWTWKQKIRVKNILVQASPHHYTYTSVTSQDNIPICESTFSRVAQPCCSVLSACLINQRDGGEK